MGTDTTNGHALEAYKDTSSIQTADAEKEVQAINYENRRFVSIEDMVYLLGGTVSYQNDTKTNIHIPETNLFQPSIIVEGSRKTVTFEMEIDSYAAAVMGSERGHFLYTKNADEKLYPASTTKIMTALVALEHGNISDLVVVSEEVKQVPWDSSKANIQPGDELTLEQLLYGMMLPSGNDAAIAIAVHIGGTVEKFVGMMNEKAAEIGADSTNFINPHGYHDPNQYTTAKDLAIISSEALKKPLFNNLISKEHYKAVFKNLKGKTVTRNWRTTNQLLRTDSPLYNKEIVGGKNRFHKCFSLYISQFYRA